MLTVKETAERLGVSLSTVYRWVDDGDIEAVCEKKPSPVQRSRRYKGAISIPEAQVEALLAASKAA